MQSFVSWLEGLFVGRITQKRLGGGLNQTWLRTGNVSKKNKDPEKEAARGSKPRLGSTRVREYRMISELLLFCGFTTY